MEFWRKRIGLLFVLLLVTGLASAQSVSDLVDRLHRGEAATSIDLPTDKPWHLKMTFQLLGVNQQVSDSGTVEEWWAPGKHRIAVVSAGYNSVEVLNGQGLFRSASTDEIPYAIDELRTTVIHPMPADLAIKDAKPELRPLKVGTAQFDCVMLSQKIGVGLTEGRVDVRDIAGLGLFPTSCFDRGADSLRMIADSATETIVLSTLGRFRERMVGLTLFTQRSGKILSKAHVETLTGATEEQGTFGDVGMLSLVDADPVSVDSKVIRGKILSKADPIYPDSAKFSHVAGVVILDAVIGRDGHIRKLQAKQVPSPALAVAAIQAVRQWVYSPYLLDGKPKEVKTTITVDFTFR